MAGRTVGYVRDQLEAIWGIRKNTLVLINGKQRAEDTVLRSGDDLHFVIDHGKKGVGRVWTDQEFMDLLRATKNDLDYLEAKGCKCIHLRDSSRRWTETGVDDFVRGLHLEGDEGVSAILTQLSTMLAPQLTPSAQIASSAARDRKTPRVRPDTHAPRRAPVWDADRRELRDGQTVMKKYRQRAGNQVIILAAFQEQGWPTRIDDPLPGKGDADPTQRLRQTLSDLNKAQKNRPMRIHFEPDGTGQAIIWAWI